ncbi:MAG: YfiR family protein [Proteobacteria bacterium]|nr:YfiR family protein [Pseudomonadota bacterium]
MHKGQLFVKVLLVCIVFGLFEASAEPKSSDLNKKKAGVVYNLSKFINWPGKVFPNEKFNICLIGKVVFLDAMKTFEKRQIRGQAVQVHVLNNLENLSNCQTLYINSSQSLANILPLMKGKSILTISDIPGFSLHGGMIELIQIEKRVQFAINLDAAKSVNLLISAQLLRLAKTVKYKDSQINNP